LRMNCTARKKTLRAKVLTSRARARKQICSPGLAAGSGIAMFCHPERDCIYQESAIVKEFGYERPAIVDLQMACYRARGYPEHNGLNLGGVIFRRHHDPKIRLAMVDRWHQIEIVQP